MRSVWRAERNDDMPPMAWLTRCEPACVTLHHGRAVEVRENSFFEGAWSGPFDDWDFASANSVAGSGAVATPDGILFITPSHTLEGLYYHRHGETLTVSNSIVFLLKTIGKPIRNDIHFGARMASAVKGIHEYSRHVAATTSGPVRRAIFNNLLLVPDGRVIEQAKPDSFLFDDYASYRDTLSREIRLLFENAATTGRTRLYTPLSTCSSGYDSAACLVFANEFGCREAVSLRLDEDDSDSGREIAERLGVTIRCFERPRPDDATAAEFVASGMGGEDLAYANFGEVLSGKLLLTGFHGDKIWSKGIAPNHCLERGDVSGSSLGEFRLRSGFIHLPVPFIAGLHHPKIAAISNSEHMRPWSVGGWYDRPIPRRIVETAGVPRAAFGQAKKAASLPLFMDKSGQSNDAWKAMLSEVAGLPLTERIRFRAASALFSFRLASARFLQKASTPRLRLRRLALFLRDLIAGDPRLFEHDAPDTYFLFRRAFEATKSRYPDIPD